VHLATIGPHAYFGEMSLFDDSPRSTSAVALQDTLTLQTATRATGRVGPPRPQPGAELIKVLSRHLRTANDRIAEMTHSRRARSTSYTTPWKVDRGLAAE